MFTVFTPFHETMDRAQYINRSSSLHLSCSYLPPYCSSSSSKTTPISRMNLLDQFCSCLATVPTALAASQLKSLQVTPSFFLRVNAEVSLDDALSLLSNRSFSTLQEYSNLSSTSLHRSLVPRLISIAPINPSTIATSSPSPRVGMSNGCRKVRGVSELEIVAKVSTYENMS